MTELTITPNYAKKRLKASGTIAAGEHVAVTVVGGKAWIGEGSALRLRLVCDNRLMAIFPYVTAQMVTDDETGRFAEVDEWSYDGDDATCTLNLNTIPVEKRLGCGGCGHLILDDAENHTLYGIGEIELTPWPKRRGADVPYSLDEYPDIIADYREEMDNFFADVNQRVAEIERNLITHAGNTTAHITADERTCWNNKQDPIDDLAEIRENAATGAEAYHLPDGGIPKTHLSAAVQTSLGKADTVTLKVSKSAFDSLLGLTLADTATQKEVRVMVQTILGVLKNAAVCLALMLALPALGVDSETVWEEVEPTNKVKDVVEKFSPPADFSTNNEELVETIHAKESFTSWTNGEAVLHGPLRIRQREDFDYVDTVISSNGVSCWRWLPYGSGGSYINYSFNWWDLLRSESDPTVPAWAKAETKPSYTAEDVGAAPASHATNKNNPHNVTIQQIGAFSASDGSTVMGIVNTWEGYWDGTNVVFEVTNYYGNSSGELPRLRIKEFRDGAWNIVWDEITKYEVCESNILYKVSESNRVLKIELKRDFAPIAWGTVTDKGSPNVVSNSVWMTSPETYFAGGTEYQRVAVGSGTICVLVDNGAGTYTAGEEGTFRFQDEGGTNYFGFAKSDSYTIGCKTDGISVEGTLVTLRYDVIMGGSDTPIVYYRQTLSAGEWVQLNNSDGTAASGAPYTVTWYTSGGSYYAAINCGDNAIGFFKAETSVAGDVVFETNMKARLGGGIECLNTANGTIGVIRPTFNGSSVSWSWSTR